MKPDSPKPVFLLSVSDPRVDIQVLVIPDGEFQISITDWKQGKRMTVDQLFPDVGSARKQVAVLVREIFRDYDNDLVDENDSASPA